MVRTVLQELLEPQDQEDHKEFEEHLDLLEPMVVQV